MINWLSALDKLTRDATPAVLVTVAIVQGSGPREPGAKMVVTRDAQFDTIGGGHLEMRACEVARGMLADTAGHLPALRRIERFPLGPSLGQCCGGVVHLAFERVIASSPAYGSLLSSRWRDRQDSWRMVPLDEVYPPVLLDARGEPVTDGLPLPPAPDRSRGCHVMQDRNGKRWLADPCRPHRPHLVVFGAGHVGAAIVRMLGELPCHVTWVDERDDMFPDDIPANVKVEATDIPEAIVDAAPAGSSFLVLTHSHALDQRLSEAILRRNDAGWFGLIGSKTKRMQFEHRLRERGISDERLADMVCPIGIAGITGKQPAVIATAVCAQLLQVWEAEEQAASRLLPISENAETAEAI
jgi:xanthine dehydrogenase accessory factor